MNNESEGNMNKAKIDLERMVAENAAKAFADHVVAVELEHGLHRHYRCGKPDSGVYAFHIVTFPGRLIVSGDIGDMAWTRCDDMLNWAMGAVHSTGYFAEKVWHSFKVKQFDGDMAREAIEQEYKDRAEDVEGEEEKEALEEVRDEILMAIEDGAENRFYAAYADSDWYGGEFPSVDNYTAEFLWCREAVAWFLKWYKTARAT